MLANMKAKVMANAEALGKEAEVPEWTKQDL